MRKWMSFLMTFLVGASSYANANSVVAFELGYRQDTITLTNYLDRDSEVRNHFKDLDIFQFGIKAKGDLGCNLYGRAEGTWGWVLDGKYDRRFSFGTNGSGNDYSGVSTDITQTAHNVVDDRYVYDATVAIGYPFYLCDCTLELAPVVGYSFDEQNLRVQERGNEFASGSDVGGGCCENKFVNRWYGPFLGVDFQYRPYNENWNVFAELEFHWAHYKGRRSDGFGRGDGYHEIRSHRGHGYVFNIGAEYDFCNEWTTSLAVKFTDFRTHKNNHHNDSSSSSSDFGYSSEGPGSEVHAGKQKWRSYAVTLAFGRGF